MVPTLVLIDIQKDYFPKGRMELVNPIKASENAKKLLDAFRSRKYPIVHVRHISTSESASFFKPNTDGIDFDTKVQPLDGEKIITKHFPNSFRETELKEHLDGLGTKDVIFCGMMSHMCVDATVRAAADLGYNTSLAHDACATRNLTFGGTEVQSSDVHASFMAALSGTYASVKNTDEILNDLT